MNGILFACGGLLTAASAWFSYLHRAGIDAVTGLAGSMKWNYAAMLLAAMTLLIWGILSYCRLPPRPVKQPDGKPEKEDKSEENKTIYIADCLDKTLPGYAFAFYVAAFLLFLMAVVFFLLLMLTALTPVRALLVILSVGTAAAFWRAAMIYIRRRVSPADAIILPLPLIFLAAFGLYEYTIIMLEPETLTYGLDILAIVAVLLSVYGFFSHYFGRPASRLALFASLSASSLGAIAYFTRALLFFCEKVALSSADGSLYLFLAELMLFASTSIFSVSYAIILWDSNRKS